VIGSLTRFMFVGSGMAPCSVAGPYLPHPLGIRTYK
jgi:hypothetical protein